MVFVMSAAGARLSQRPGERCIPRSVILHSSPIRQFIQQGFSTQRWHSRWRSGSTALQVAKPCHDRSAKVGIYQGLRKTQKPSKKRGDQTSRLGSSNLLGFFYTRGRYRLNLKHLQPWALYCSQSCQKYDNEAAGKLTAWEWGLRESR